MEVKLVGGCLNIIDIAIGKDIDIWSLENIREYLLERGMTDFDGECDALMCVFKQINLIIDNLYQPCGEDQKKKYITLRKMILIWIIEYNRKL